MLHRRFLRLLVLLAGYVTGTTSAFAGMELVVNGGFELPGFTPSPNYYQYFTNGDTFVTNWTVNLDGSGEASYLVERGGTYDAYILAGNYGIILKEGDTLSTNLSLFAGNNYTVSFKAMENSGDEDFHALHITVDTQSFFFDPTVFPTGTDYSFNFIASSTGMSTLSFATVSSFSFHSIALDSVSVVPEPAALGWWAGGLALSLVVGRRRRKRQRALPRE